MRKTTMTSVALLSLAFAAVAEPGMAWNGTDDTPELTNNDPDAGGAKIAFDIAAQPLNQALNTFAQQADLRIVFDTAAAEGVSAPAVSGNLTAQKALEMLLGASNLTYRFMDERTVAVDAPVKTSTDAGVGEGNLRLAQTGEADSSGSGGAGDVDSTRNSNGGSEDSNTKLEEIVVTAQKRTERWIDVPLSITALSAAAIENRGLVSAGDYLRSIPAVSYVDQGPGQNVLVLRGAYGTPFDTGPTVGVYFGDIPLAGLALGSSTDIKLVDIERVEVLRGPQGTLYGSNSLSGTVRYIPADPDPGRFDARVAVGYSSTRGFGGNNSDVEGMLNLPLVSDRLALRAVAYRYENTGYIRNIAGDDPALQASADFFDASGQAGNQDHIGGSTYTGGKVSLLWKPVEALNVGLTYLHQDDDADDRAFAQRGFARFERSTYRFGPFVGSGDAMKIGLDIANLALTWRTPWGSFLSSTSYVEQDYRRLWEIGLFFPVGGFQAPMPQTSLTKAKLLTEEARFTSSFGGPVQFVAGVYFEDSEQPTTQFTYYAGRDLSLNPLSPGTQGPVYSIYLDRQVEQIAGFGEVTYAFTPKLEFALGARTFHYESKFVQNLFQSTNPAVLPVTATTVESSESGETYKAGARFKPTENTLVYATYAEGFRLGRPQDIALVQNLCDLDDDGLIDGTDLSSTNNLIASDSLQSAELGAKITMLNGRASLSGAIYRNDWKDIPVTFRPDACSAVSIAINAGKVRATGMELEGALNVGRLLYLDFGVGYVNSKLATTSPLGNEGDLMNYTPKWNGHLGAEYRGTLASRDSYVRGDYSYFGTYYNGIGETGSKFDAYGVLGLSMGMRFDPIDLRVFVDNVTDKYAIGSDSNWPANGIYPIRPRTIGMRLGVTF